MQNFQSVTIISNTQEIQKQVWLLQEVQKEDFLLNSGRCSEWISIDY